MEQEMPRPRTTAPEAESLGITPTALAMRRLRARRGTRPRTVARPDPPQWDHLEKLRAAADLSKAELSRRLHRQPAWYSQRHQSRRQLPESVVAEIAAICEKAAKERVKAAMVAL